MPTDLKGPRVTWGNVLGLPHGTTPASVIKKPMNVNSFEGSDKIQRTECVTYCAISVNEASSVTFDKTGNVQQKIVV